MSRIECKWAKSFILPHLHSIRLMWSTASELGLTLDCVCVVSNLNTKYSIEASWTLWINFDCVFEAWFRIWIPNTQSRLRELRLRVWSVVSNLNTKYSIEASWTLWINFDCVFEAWFRIWIPNTQSRLRELCELTSIACLKRGFEFEYQILNRGFVNFVN